MNLKISTRFIVEELESRSLPTAIPLLITAGGPGGEPRVNLPAGPDRAEAISILAYGADFIGGINLAMGDFNQDGVLDVATGAGGGGGPHVRLFNGLTGQPFPGPLGNFMAFSPDFRGGVVVASGDLTGDGRDDLVVGAGPGGSPQVRIFDGATGKEFAHFLAFNEQFTGGVRLSVGDISGDGVADLLLGAGAGGGPHVRALDVFNDRNLASFFAFDSAFRGGVSVSAADLNGDAIADLLIGAGPGGGPHIRTYDGATLEGMDSFYAFNPGFRWGVAVGAADVTQTGWLDILATPEVGGGPLVAGFSGRTGDPLFKEFLAGQGPHTTLTVASADLSRFDQLVVGKWYVPVENLLAYLVVDPANPTPIGDQTLWDITTSTNGKFSGTTSATFAIPTSGGLVTFSSSATMEGWITPEGRIRMDFTSTTGSVVTGVGNLRFVDGRWAMQMQMATGEGDGFVAHWAYMLKLGQGDIPPEPTPDGFIDADLRSEEWNWLLGTRWDLVDTGLFGTTTTEGKTLPGRGVYSIEGYRNGYFWGTGQSTTTSFGVFGSVTPEGTVFLTVSQPDEPLVTRTGTLRNTPQGGLMTWRSYDGTAELGRGQQILA